MKGSYSSRWTARLLILVIVIGLGVSLGLTLPLKGVYATPAASHVVGRLSAVLGWIYFTAWSISFYPQIITNYRRQSVEGLSLDYVAFNILGFACYAVYDVSIYFSPSIQAAFARQAGHGAPAVTAANDGTGSSSGFSDSHHHYHHPQGGNSVSSNSYTTSNGTTIVELNDVFFSVHAVVLCLVVAFQCVLYARPTHRVSKFTKFIIAATSLAIIIYTVYTMAAVEIIKGRSNNSSGSGSTYAERYHLKGGGASSSSLSSPQPPACDTGCLWVNFLTAVSFVKVMVSVAKYTPQVWLNMSRQSTVGWSVDNIILDLTGGCLSVVQMILDTVSSHSFTPTAFLFSPKLALGLLSIIYDSIFVWQHFVLYTDRYDPQLGAGIDSERESTEERVALFPSRRNAREEEGEKQRLLPPLHQEEAGRRDETLRRLYRPTIRRPSGSNEVAHGSDSPGAGFGTFSSYSGDSEEGISSP